MVSSVLGYTVNNLPSVAFYDRHSLPDQPGVYFLRAGDGPVIYIGQAKSLFKRWRGYNHEKSRIVESLERQNPTVQYKLHFLCVSTADLDRVEKEAIKGLAPDWNNRSRGESTKPSLLEIERRVSGLEVSMTALAYGQSASTATSDAYGNQTAAKQTTLFEQLGVPSGEFTPSPQQKAIFDWVQHGSGDAVVIACAGSGKTTTLVQACRLMRGSIRVLAFNNSIQAELKKRLRKVGVAATVYTVNGYGNHLCRIYKNNIDFQELKYYRILGELRKERWGGQSWSDSDLFSIDVLHKCQTQCFSPDGSFDEYETVMHKFGCVALEEQYEIIKTALSRGVNNFIEKGEMDYGDQIWLPHVLGMNSHGADFTCVDECQDLSPAQFSLVLKSRGNGRSLWVGDPNQAIYLFNGAASDSVEKIKEKLGATEFPLSVSYRCAKAVVAKARESGSIIEAHQTAPQGVVKEISLDIDKTHQILLPGDLVISHRWVSLVSVFLKCRECGQRVFFESNKAEQLIEKMVSFVDGHMKAGIAFKSFKEKLDEGIKQARFSVAFSRGNHVAYERKQLDLLCALDKFYGLYTPDSYDSLKNIIFKEFGGKKSGKYILLSTIHGAKGLEANRVFVLDWQGFGFSSSHGSGESAKQMENLSYVAVTRAKTELNLVQINYGLGDKGADVDYDYEIDEDW